MELKTVFKQHLVPISLDRNHQRDTTKYRRREKPKGTKNQNDTI